MDNKYITTKDGRKFRLSMEPREGHPDLSKAVLSEKLGAKYQKINVWKPGADKPKVSFATSHTPPKIAEAFEKYKNCIESYERELNIADY